MDRERKMHKATKAEKELLHDLERIRKEKEEEERGRKEQERREEEE